MARLIEVLEWPCVKEPEASAGNTLEIVRRNGNQRFELGEFEGGLQRKSGVRENSAMMVQVNSRRAVEAGVKFFNCCNGVILTSRTQFPSLLY